MNLFQYSIITSILLLALGLTIWIRRSNICNDILVFARSNKASVLLLTISLVWFLFRYVKNLTEADFGNHKLIIGMVAVFIYFGSFALVKDFLSVRSLSILCLFYAREVLDSAWLQDPPSRLLLVSTIYVIIVLALYFGAWPYRFRDFFEWLNIKVNRVKILATTITFIGLALLLVSFTL